ncbi:MAG: TIGR02757 family protein, partial [Polyangiaceae bacterium]
ADPVAFVHRYARRDDREIVALVAASIAFGNVTTIRGKLEDLLRRLGPSPARAAGDAARVHARLRTWKHRVFRGEDVACLLVGARHVQQRHGSLGALFARELRTTGDFREALARWCDAVRDAGGLGARKGSGARRGPAHLLPDVRAGSGAKRLLLFLRWMVRPDDGVDLGLWRGEGIDTAKLLVPVDVHIHKLSRNLGLTRRAGTSWATTVEITRALAAFDARDPVKYDFSLCHLGMLQRCPSRRDPSRCQGCPVQPVCVHWAARDSDSLGGAP